MTSDTAERPGSHRPALRRPPLREEIDELPPFDAIEIDRITVVADAAGLVRAEAVLAAAPWLGFDTESRPTFVRGEVSDGPHLVQFATLDHAWLLPLHVDGSMDLVARLFCTDRVLKVGFGLDSDRALIARRTGFAARGIVDIDAHFRQVGYRGSLGLRSAVAVVLGRRFTKSKRVGTSNWSARSLNESQILYAANDAYGAAWVYEALGRPSIESRSTESSARTARAPAPATPRSARPAAAASPASVPQGPSPIPVDPGASASVQPPGPAPVSSPSAVRRLPALLRRPGG